MQTSGVSGQGSGVNGIYAIWKPVGPTSHDIIDELRKITGIRTIGHAGTLDPLAQGVLVVAIGKENTRKIDEIVATEKEYIADVKLGATSTTDDEEGLKEHLTLDRKPTLNEITDIIPSFIGNIKQVPPIYSAIKMKGETAYKLARQGLKPAMEPRDVEIREIEVLRYEYPDLRIRVVTGKGVYIRSLARDIGAELKTGGYLAGLERTRVGKFMKADSLTLEEFRQNIKQ